MESDLRFPLRRRCCRPGVNQCNQIPRGARAKTKPWALTSELVEAVEDRRVARRDMRSDNPSTKERWVEAKRRAAEVERRVYQKQFRDFVSDTLNKHQSPGRVHKTLKMWGGGCLRRPTSSWRGHRGQRANPRNGPRERHGLQPHIRHLSKQVRNKRVDSDAKARLKATNEGPATSVGARRTGTAHRSLKRNWSARFPRHNSRNSQAQMICTTSTSSTSVQERARLFLTSSITHGVSELSHKSGAVPSSSPFRSRGRARGRSSATGPSP